VVRDGDPEIDDVALMDLQGPGEEVRVFEYFAAG
jgi:hypothetical protein